MKRLAVLGVVPAFVFLLAHTMAGADPPERAHLPETVATVVASLTPSTPAHSDPAPSTTQPEVVPAAAPTLQIAQSATEPTTTLPEILNAPEQVDTSEVGIPTPDAAPCASTIWWLDTGDGWATVDQCTVELNSGIDPSRLHAEPPAEASAP